MSEPVVIIGIGEVGGVLARGLLKSGHPVYPVTRGMNLCNEGKKIQNPLAVIVAVSEDDFRSVMQDLPDIWKDRLILLQNELLPSDWKEAGIQDPTIFVVWFEKKNRTGLQSADAFACFRTPLRTDTEFAGFIKYSF